jgi:hypothetical protein
VRLLRAATVVLLAAGATSFLAAAGAAAAPSAGCNAASAGAYDHRLEADAGDAGSWTFTTAPLNVGEILVFTATLTGGDEATGVTVEDNTTAAPNASPGSDVHSVPFRILSNIRLGGPGPTTQSVPHMIPIAGGRTFVYTLDNEASAVAAEAAISAICLQSDPAPAVLILTTAFVDNPVAPGGEATVKFVIQNRLHGAIHSIGFTDVFPSVLQASPPPTIKLTCGGDFITTAEELTFEGGTLAAGASCSFSVTLNVSPDLPPGAHVNVTTAITGEYFGFGIHGPPASDKLLVGKR